MNTELIGIKDFRANVADYVARARSGNSRVFVMNRNKPLFEIKPFDEDAGVDSLLIELAQRRKQVEEGKFVTQEEMLKKYGL